ncbi:hypothetical protein [Microbacterium sp. MPKO10]|uniref:hypothetical protein n=1 Tax=Microbacterium sp. MPKO10 TaxID=2989818 RepID=UPI0022369A72|nr:hypothetical protein [Microbacterium sp. MPKO10]MCW4459610.1 hypothetical protein [Microbacterium sp. MPKO10]
MTQSLSNRQADSRWPTSSEATMCGYSPLRRLHTGERTTAFLARAPGSEVHVVLRVFTGPDGPARALTELEMAAQVDTPHLQRAKDIGVSPTNDPVLVTARLGRRLSELLDGGGHIAPGSIVTLAAPLAAALRCLHENGIAHGAVDVAHIRLASDGSPVLVGADGGLSATPTNVRSDLEGFAHLLDSVLQNSDGSCRSRGMSEITAWLRNRCQGPDRPPPDTYADLERRIFALATPLPFAVGERQPVPTQRTDWVRDRSVRRRDGGSPVAALLEGELSFSLEETRNLLRQIVDRLRGRRGRLVLVAVLIFAVFLTGTLWLLPQRTSADESSSAPTKRPVPPATMADVAPADLDESKALDKLLAMRRVCQEQSHAARCLAHVYETGSPALEADRAALGASARDPFPVLSLEPARRDVTAQRVSGGFAAFIVRDSDAKNQPVSVILTMTETGWLIRDIFDA